VGGGADRPGLDPLAAEADPRAHGITRWLGIDAPDPRPQVSRVEINGQGRLLICTDGLWNYASGPSALEALVTRGSCLDASRALVEFALEHGGHDNITAVVVSIEPSPTVDEES
jgi:serine/threonine protein phosphatase PrpC